MQEDLAELLDALATGCPLWPEQTEGPYHRDLAAERTDITEGRPGVPLRLGLRLLASKTWTPLANVPVEIWQADHEGRYSGFPAFHAAPGQIVTSESVPHDLVAPDETFLRGSQRTDERGMCAFHTIYPGWYSSRAVHIHFRAHLGDGTATTQLYFPDAITDSVLEVPPYAGREQRDTLNHTDSIFMDEGGEAAILQVTGSVSAGFTAILCFAVPDVEA